MNRQMLDEERLVNNVFVNCLGSKTPETELEVSVFCRNFVWLVLVLVLILEIWSHSIVVTIPELSISARQALILERPLGLPRAEFNGKIPTSC